MITAAVSNAVDSHEQESLHVETNIGGLLQEERTSVTVQEGADLPLHHLRLDAPQQPELWKEQYKVRWRTLPTTGTLHIQHRYILVVV